MPLDVMKVPKDVLLEAILFGMMDNLENMELEVMPLLEENRVNYICESNFRASSQMEKLVKLILESMSLTNQLLEKESHQY